MVLHETTRERSGNQTAFFDVLFNYANHPPRTIQLGGATVTRTDLADPIAKCPITFYVDDLNEDFRIRLLYQTELFDAEKIGTFLDQYAVLLAASVASPDLPVCAHSLVTDKCRLVTPDPGQLIDTEPMPTICELFLQQVTQTPDHPALTSSECTWSYSELAERANMIAQGLCAAGIKKSDVVAITGGRHPGFVAGMLGAFLCGAVVLPIDKKLPNQRKQLMLEQARAKGIIWIGEEQQEIGHAASLIELKVNNDGGCEWNGAEMPGQVPISGDDPAYIFFTSGTTGIPKAVLGRHKGLSHFLQWQKAEFRVGPADRCAQLIGLSFDVVLRDILLPLISGAALCLPADDDDLSAGTVLPWLVKERITSIHTTPSIAASWLRSESQASALSDLRLVFFAGEPLTSATVRRWRTQFSFAGEIVNLYGPTETTLAKCFYRAPQEPAALLPVLPVGKTLPQTQALILGKNNMLCGINEAGEIVLRTPFRSLGYLNGDLQENAKFRKNPFRDQEDDLLYYTGDRGRYRPDGNLEILGRADDQVKIRGIRIELSEITAVLSQYDGVDTCAVVPDTTMDGDTRLIAYVVKRQGSKVEDKELKNYLAERLPSAMVPAAFVTLKSLPLTANGKLDRKALPSVAKLEFEQGSSNAARTPEEEKLGLIFQKVLRKTVIGIHQSFFELGGHSLLAMELVSEIRRAFQAHIPLKQLFETPTIAGLAEILTRYNQNPGVPGATSHELKVDQEHRYEAFPLTDIQQAYWVGRSSSFELGNVATHSYSEFEFTQLDTERFNQAFHQLVERHEMLRAIVTSEGEQRILKNVPEHPIPVHDLRNKSAREREDALMQIRNRLSHQVLPLDQWPLFEIAISQIDEERSLVHLSMDALICDAWSRRILGSELLHLYRTPEIALPGLELSFRDYVMAETELRQQPVYKQSQDYWLNRLAELPPAPELPLAKSPGSLSHPNFVRLRSRLEPEAWQRLKTNASRRGLTPSGIICAAYAELLGMWNKNSEFTINLTLFNRLPLHPQVNEIIGDFTSLVLLGIQGKRAPVFESRARQVQQQLWDDLDHRYFSGVKVLRELNRKQGGSGQTLMPIVLTSALFGGASGNDEKVHAWQKDMAYGISQTPQVYLDHGVSEQGGALVITWDYIEELFPAGMMKAMFAGYERMLRALAEEEGNWSKERLDGLLLGEQLEERAAINATGTAIPEGLLHEGFLKRAEERPEATAVVSGRRRISYSQLLQEANHVAVQLQELGVESNELVAVVMEKGWEQIVGVLGILQSGGAYLPIEAGLPQARREQLLEQGGARVVLTQGWLADKLEWSEAVKVIRVEEQGEREGREEIAIRPRQKATDLAYVIFTSGSTGVPKGVMIDHRAALNTVVDINERFGVGSTDRVLGLSSLSFDLSVYDVFGVLGAGGTLVLPGAEARRDPQEWLELLEREQVTMWNTVPALLEMLVEYVEGGKGKLPESLRLALLSGDWIAVTLPERVKKLQGGVKVVSLGGATEAAIWSIVYEIGEVGREWKSIPYGRPMKNQSIHVLHENYTECPVWVPGQLYIGGVGLAQGYWRDEEKTAKRFVTHPGTGERLYETGDIGRCLPDGEIEFLGRKTIR